MSTGVVELFVCRFHSFNRSSFLERGLYLFDEPPPSLSLSRPPDSRSAESWIAERSKIQGPLTTSAGGKLAGSGAHTLCLSLDIGLQKAPSFNSSTNKTSIKKTGPVNKSSNADQNTKP